MKHFTKLLLSLLLIAGVSLGYADLKSQRAQKLIEEGDKIVEPLVPPSIEGINSGWLPQPLDPASITYGGAQYLAPSTVFLSGYSSTADYLWRSYDHGGSWTKLAPPSNNAGIVFSARDSNLILVGTFAGTMLRSTNGGAKWDTVYQHTDYIDGVAFVGDTVAVALGDMDAKGPLLIRSTNAGKTWTRLTLSAADSAMAYGYATYRQCISVYHNTVWIALYKSGTDGRVMKSTDAGATWNSWAVPLTGGTANNYYFRSINFVNDSIGFAVDRQAGTTSAFANYLHRTTNGGLTWSDTLNLQPGAHTDALARSAKGIPGTNKVLVVGAGATTAKMWMSNDLGVTFTPVTVTGTNLTNIAARDSTHIFVVGSNNVLKYTGANVRKVTFNLNTATVPDTIPVAGSTIQVRGGANGTGFSPITWSNDAQNNMTRVGGDYWTKSVYMQAGDTLNYKYTVAYSTGTGWEQGVTRVDNPSANQNRTVIVPDKDTTLNVEFWNNGANDRPQYFRPWTTVADTFMNVYFRVSMLGPISSGTFTYNADKDTVGVRGGGPAGSDLDWGRTAFLTKEAAPTNGDGYTIAPASMWSGRLKFPKSLVNAGDSLSYKFLLGDAWGRDELQSQPNRQFHIPVGKKDTTLYWVFYNNEHPAQRANPDTIKITFIANMAQAAASGGVNVLTDTIYVRTGYFTTAIESGRGKRLARVAGTTFQATDTIVTAKKKNLDYQYYVVRNGVEVRENYYNFYFNGAVASEAERRQVIIDSTASVTNGQTVRDTATSITQARRQPVFPNGRKLARNVNVTWKCDLRPAYYQVNPAFGNDTLTDIQGTFHVYPSQKDSVMKWGVWINGPATDGWTTWGIDLQNLATKKMYDNATNGDAVSGDSVFTRKVLASPDSISSGSKALVGQVYKFGIRGGDNEGGRGGFGNNHNENIVDTDSIYTIMTDFGSINPAFYDAWDYDLHKPKKPTSVFATGQPLTYTLAQNYPNPFNPTTKIEYSIPAQAKVELKVYNIVGQEVATLVNEIQQAGEYHVKFNALNFASGMYFYRLTAGDFVSVKKMVLVK